MEGKFLSRNKTNFWLVLLLLCGIFFVFLWFFLRSTDDEATGALNTLLIMGILIALVAIPSMLLNFRAYFHIGENSIKAKYHWFGRLDCAIQDVEFVLPQINTLTVLLKNGKRHTIMGLDNSWELSSAIRSKIFRMETESPEIIQKELNRLQNIRRKEILWTAGATALMFANIFIAVLLTGARDLYEFSKLDWFLLSIMGLVELLTVMAVFYMAIRCGKHLLPIMQQKHRLRGAVIAHYPLPTNNVKTTFTDENYLGRVVVCGFPNDESVYYYVQELSGDLTLETVYTSDIYPNMDALMAEDFPNRIYFTTTM